MTTIASQITSLTIVYSTVYSDADQRKHQSSASLAFVWGIHRDRWIPRTKGQLRGKCFHLMTSSCVICRNLRQKLSVYENRCIILHNVHHNIMMSPVRRQAIYWTNAGALLIISNGNTFQWIKTQQFSYKTINLKISALLSLPQCLYVLEITPPRCPNASEFGMDPLGLKCVSFGTLWNNFWF